MQASKMNLFISHAYMRTWFSSNVTTNAFIRGMVLEGSRCNPVRELFWDCKPSAMQYKYVYQLPAVADLVFITRALNK